MSPRHVASRSLCFLALFAVGLLLRPHRARLSSSALRCTALHCIEVAGILSGHVDVPQRAWMIENGEQLLKPYGKCRFGSFPIDPNRRLNLDRISTITIPEMETLYSLWSENKRVEIATIGLKLIDASETHLLLDANGNKVQVLIPSSIQAYNEGLEKLADEVFIAMSLENSDELLDRYLHSLNEKLERIKVTPKALHDVLDLLLTMLIKFDKQSCQSERKQSHLTGGGGENLLHSKEPVQQGIIKVQSPHAVASGEEDDEHDDGGGVCNSSEMAEDDDDYDVILDTDSNDSDTDKSGADTSGYDLATEDTSVPFAEIEYRSRGFLHALAEDARKACELAQAKAVSDEASESGNDVWTWCCVSSIPMHLRVQVQFELAGIIDKRMAASLGISLDEPVTLVLEFSKLLWSDSIFSVSKPFSPESMSATQENKSSIAMPEETNTILDVEARKLRGCDHKCYGLEVLFPELTRTFFEGLNWRKAGGPEDLVSCQHCILTEKTSSLFEQLVSCVSHSNPFLGLLAFILKRLASLPNWCIVCWDSLPVSVTRLCTCDKDLCLYRFEELGLGALILQEIQNSLELVDLELSMAYSASISARDVFEPFPGFLLAKEELRGRSGWFSNVQKTDTRTSPFANKKVSVLQAILKSIPPIAKLKQCLDEAELKKVLARAWSPGVKEKRPWIIAHESAEHSQGNLMRDQAQEQWLAYDVIRFVLTTNRISLSLLDDTQKLPSLRTILQFVVLWDTPEKEAHFVQRRIDAGGSFFAFHGSPAENWYSILRNGLRSMSKTSYMSSGAALGEGIYLSTRAQTSMRYAHSTGAGWPNGRLKDGYQCLAICEIVNGSTKASHHRLDYQSDILVVPPQFEKDVAIRYVLVFHPGGHHRAVTDDMEEPIIKSEMLLQGINLHDHYHGLRHTHCEMWQAEKTAWKEVRLKLLKALTGEIQQQKASEFVEEPVLTKARESMEEEQPKRKKGKSQDNVDSSVATRAVMQEFKNVLKAISKAPQLASLGVNDDIPLLAGVSVNIPDETDVCTWRVSLDQVLFKQNPLLIKDLGDLKLALRVQDDVNVELEVKFSANYPFHPPFVRVLSPRFRMHTGHVTVGGSICMELLTASGWSPACSLESLLVQVVMAIVEGKGRVDLAGSTLRKEYQEKDAHEAFERAARTHGWKTS